MTDSPLLPRRTVSRPSHAWNPTSPTAANDGQRIERRSRWSTDGQEASPRISKPMTTATVRWIHSIQALVSSERRDQLAVAERPVGAAQARIRGAHDDPDRDQPESGREGRARRASGSGSRAAILPRRQVRTERETPDAR